MDNDWNKILYIKVICKVMFVFLTELKKSNVFIFFY